ncbi:MAG: SAM-dependent chlorinase/fluorinase [Methanosarcinaceae archaeon]|nr:SAM-dependent chlorinase/fluorinase [Methanosarcinaceae archaeon]
METDKMMVRPVITLLTDFGKIYPAMMKGKILSGCPEALIIDMTHEIPAGNISAGSLVLSQCASAFPEKTIHVAVVDPGVGSSRKALLIRCRGPDRYFIGPDNGLLVRASFGGAGGTDLSGIVPASDRRSGDIPDVFVIDESLPLFGNASKTFHGRDIFAPAAAALANGCFPEDLGKRIDPAGIVRPPVSENIIEGSLSGEDGIVIRTTVLLTDDFGNMITSLPYEALYDKTGFSGQENLTAEIGQDDEEKDAGNPEQEKTGKKDAEKKKTDKKKAEKIKAKIVGTYSEAARGTPVLLKGSFGTLEFAVTEGSAKKYSEERGFRTEDGCRLTIRITEKRTDEEQAEQETNG